MLAQYTARVDRHADVTPAFAPPLGATLTDAGATFAVYAGTADAVEVCLFDPPDGRDADEVPVAELLERRIRLPHRVHGVWFGEVEGVRAGQRYGFRAHGPWRPDRGQRHNPDKLVLDPYGHGLDGGVVLAPEIFGHAVGDTLWGSSDVIDHRDSAPYVPRSVVVHHDFDWGEDSPPYIHPQETVIYEAHVKGMTQLHPVVPPELRGTYAGMAHPSVIEHLTALGVTSVELLPIHASTSEVHLAREGRTNYWGYSTLSFFAPHPQYAAADDPQGVVDEVKAMVAAYHAAGMEVLLDVVYNHTAEAAVDGPTLCWRGLDNTSYYRLDDWGHDIDVTGCGNTLDLRDPMTCKLVLDSLRHWVQEYHIDGFRFDLAVALARGRYDDYDPGHPFLVALRADPVLSRVKLIAEPWDVGAHGWRTGQFPPPFSEWNDRFRDTVRTFWLADVPSPYGHGVRELATRLAGSQDLFGHSDRRTYASVNYTASHDGFTLADTTAYNWKHNQANGEHNRDGHGDNRSWNHGVEGPTSEEDVLARRRRSIRNLLATTLLATGTPMIGHGDELGRTQGGNNNAYCQDNPTSWIDWDLADWQESLIATTAHLTNLRASHRVLRQGVFFPSHPTYGEGLANVSWFNSRGLPMTSADWEDPGCRVVQMLLIGSDLDARSLLLVFQGFNENAHVTLPPVDEGLAFELLWDSSWEHPGRGGRVGGAHTVDIHPSTMQVYLIV